MTQSTILASGTAAATSTDITIAAGAVATVGIFTAAASQSLDGYFSIMQDTPGEDAFVGILNGLQRSVQLAGPGVFRVKRPLISTAFGVFLEV